MSLALSTALAQRESEEQVVYSPQDIEEMDTQTLLDLYKQTGDQNLKWPLVMRYEGLIKKVAIHMRGVFGQFAEVDDIIDEGILTLLSAIDKYDPDKGVKFETYVDKRIHGMIIDMARKADWIPRNIRKRGREIDQSVSRLANSLGRYPTEQEVASDLGITLAQYQKENASVLLSNVLSLDALIEASSDDGRRMDMDIPDDNNEWQPEQIFLTQEVQQALADGIRHLRKNEQIVLSLYYEKNLSMREIAQVMDLSKPRISQIHVRALQKLQQHMKAYLSDSSSEEKHK